MDLVLAHKILHKKSMQTDKISKTMNDRGSDCGSFSELSDSDTCEPNLPISCSSSKQRKRKELSTQSLREADTEVAGPFLNVHIQVLSQDGKNKFSRFRNLHFLE